MRRRFSSEISVPVCTVLKGILLIGFTIQIFLGLAWMCCNVFQVQDFGKIDTAGAGYRALFGLLGEQPTLMYLLQLALAYFAADLFLSRFVKIEKKWFTVWCSLALLTFPFALQCHLALLPYSFMGSLALLVFFFLCKASVGERPLCSLGLAVLCGVLAFVLSGAADVDRKNMPGRSLEAAMAGRIAWPTLWVDYERWPEEVQELTEDVVWEAAFRPGNLKLLQAAIENRATEEEAKEAYRQIAKIGWDYHAYMVVRQIGWDVLGYGVTPIVFRLQLQGEAYDSCTGRNYEAMRGNAPVLTRCYVEYSCWWFGCGLGLTLLLLVVWWAAGRVGWRWIRPAAVCILAAGLWIAFLTMRGAGLMDYKYTIAVNQLWLLWAFWLMDIQCGRDALCEG